MAEVISPSSSSDSEPEVIPKKPSLKRRRFFTDNAVAAVPVYSTKVQKSLQLLPKSLKLSYIPQILNTSDDEEDTISSEKTQVVEETRCQNMSPSPPPPPPPPRLRRACRRDKCSCNQSGCRILNQLEFPNLVQGILKQRLESLTSSLSAAKKSLQDEETDADSNDVILIDASDSQELLLKVRCRADLHRVSIRMTDPLQKVIEHMGQTLKVPPNRILLLLRDRELAADATPGRLGLGVADIVDCIVETNNKQSSDSGNLQLRVQGKDKSSEMEITVQKGEPLQVLMNHYRQAQGLGRRKLVFHFDGQKLMETWTPEELGMESGDVIEVWS
ncbi:NFATC2-interacting protein isoform X1 [Anolis carolinensis]|nr:PREDICTED: NFATC2-interacting protein isoform X1 [Anolis carolinensis]|eukprot:XP_016851659.1 PREDICTED: NFATC2-interacting protein isoform X1 [Anolis carolinensis]